LSRTGPVPQCAGVTGERARRAAPALVLLQITSLQLGSAPARGLFRDVGATAAAALRITLAAVVLCAVVGPALRGRRSTQGTS